MSGKTKLFFTTAVSMWPNAEFYIKVDDDVHVNIGILVNTIFIFIYIHFIIFKETLNMYIHIYRRNNLDGC